MHVSRRLVNNRPMQAFRQSINISGNSNGIKTRTDSKCGKIMPGSKSKYEYLGTSLDLAQGVVRPTEERFKLVREAVESMLVKAQFRQGTS